MRIRSFWSLPGGRDGGRESFYQPCPRQPCVSSCLPHSSETRSNSSFLLQPVSLRDFRHVVIDAFINMLSILTLAFFCLNPSCYSFCNRFQARCAATLAKATLMAAILMGLFVAGGTYVECGASLPLIPNSDNETYIGCAGHPFWHATIVYLDGGPWVHRAIAGMACVYCLLCSHTLSCFRRLKKNACP